MKKKIINLLPILLCVGFMLYLGNSARARAARQCRIDKETQMPCIKKAENPTVFSLGPLDFFETNM